MKNYLAVILSIMFLTILFGCSEKNQNDSNKYKIEYSFELKRNNHVGNNWSHHVYLNNNPISNEYIIELNNNSDLNIEVEICEHDSYDDIGKAFITLNSESKTKETIEIIIREKHGRYKGKTATWVVHCSLTKI